MGIFITLTMSPISHVIAAIKQAIWWNEVDECLSVASFRPSPLNSLVFGSKAIRVHLNEIHPCISPLSGVAARFKYVPTYLSLVLFLLATQKK